MARKPRLHIAGALYHVILRGNAAMTGRNASTLGHGLAAVNAKAGRESGTRIWIDNSYNAVMQA